MGAHAEHTDHERTSPKVAPDRSVAVRRAPIGGTPTSSRGIVRPGLEEAIARASSTRGPVTAARQGRIQRSAHASPAASVGRDPSRVVRRVDIAQANETREVNRVLLEVEVNLMTGQFDALMSTLPDLQNFSMMAMTQPAMIGAYFGQLPRANVFIDQLARQMDRVKSLLDARRPQIISEPGKAHLQMLDVQLAALGRDLLAWRSMVAAAPPGSPILTEVLARSGYYRSTINASIRPLLTKNEDEIKGVPTAPPPPPPMTEQEISDGMPADAVAQKQAVVQQVEQRGR